VREATPSGHSEAPAVDIRRERPYLLRPAPWSALVRRVLSILVLAALDVAGLALGLYAALVLRSFVFREEIFWSLLWDAGPREWLPFLAPITMLVFLQAGLYSVRERRAGPGRVVSSLVLVAMIVLAFGFGTDYDFRTTGLFPTSVVTCAIAIGAFRTAYESASLEIMKLIGIRRRVVLVGEGEALAHLQRQLLATRGGLGVELVGAIARGAVPRGMRVLADDLADVGGVLERVHPDELLLAEADLDERTVFDIVSRAHRHGVRVKLAPSTTELLVHEGEYIPGQGIPLFDVRPPILGGVAWVVKRAFDLVLSVVFLVVGLPLLLVVIVAVKLESRGPVLYVDRRIGVGGREFGMFKFRTMVVDAAARQEALELENEASGALFKIRDDPRVTRVGRVLRRLSIDELPQLANVLRGEMSLVGPRPLPLRDHALLEDWHAARYNVLPGMTGLWQISGRSGLEFDDLVRLDFTYIENWSIWSDISIIAKTIPAVLTGRGAY
jgi:exopolysaccharide biosynthesis polyprenyl glycosylphosphotransferase